MELKNRIKNIINYFERIKKEDPRCGDVFCGTCGGYGSAIKESMDEQMNNEILEILNVVEKMDTDDMQMLYKWSEFLSTMYGGDKLRLVYNHVGKIKKKEEMRRNYERVKSLDLKNVWEMDHFLFHERSLRFDKYKLDDEQNCIGDLYTSILKSGIELAIETRNKSLCESIFIILDSEALQYPNFIEAVLEVCPDRIIKSYFKMLPEEEQEEKRNSYILKRQVFEERKIAKQKILIDTTYEFYKTLKEGGLLNNSISRESRRISWFIRKTLEEIVSENMTDREVQEYFKKKSIDNLVDMQLF